MNNNTITLLSTFQKLLYVHVAVMGMDQIKIIIQYSKIQVHLKGKFQS